MNVYYSEIKVGFQHVFFFPPISKGHLFYCSVLRRAQRQTPARALEGVLDVFVLRNLSFYLPPLFFFSILQIPIRWSQPAFSGSFFFLFFSLFLNCNYVVSRRTLALVAKRLLF